MSIDRALSKKVQYEVKETYLSDFDFSEFSISEDDKEKLLEKEELIRNSQQTIAKNLYDIAKSLYESQQILSKYGTGSFVEWFKNLGIEYGFTKDDNFLFKQRVNRDDVIFLNRVIESEYCSNKITKDQKIVQVYNLERILLLEARNINVLSKITNINKSTIYRQLNYKPEEKQTRMYPSGLIFKYKEEKNVLNYE